MQFQTKPTRPQMEALKGLFDRERDTALTNLIYFAQRCREGIDEHDYLRQACDDYQEVFNRSYLQFRRSAQPLCGGDCLIIRSGGMWVGIERDGYTHT